MTTKDTQANTLTDAQAELLNQRGAKLIPKFNEVLKKEGHSEEDIQAMQDKFDKDNSQEKHELQSKLYDDIWEENLDGFTSKFKEYHGLGDKKTESQPEKPNFMQITTNLNMEKNPKSPPSETSSNKPSVSKITSTGDPFADTFSGWN